MNPEAFPPDTPDLPTAEAQPTVETTFAAEPETTEAAPSEASVESAEALQARLAERELAHQELETQFRRLAADFENYRRRQGTERENLIKFAGERILERFLEVMDNFERALQAGAKATEPQQVLTGVEMIYRQLEDFLAKEGVAAIEAKGEGFDPTRHEAVMQRDADDVPDQTVLEVFRKGYELNGRVLRPAMVQVANNPGMPAAPTPAPDNDTSPADSAQQS